MWLPSITGNSQTDSLTAVASDVCSSHWHQPSSDIGNSSRNSLDGVTVHGWVWMRQHAVEAAQRWDRINTFQKGCYAQVLSDRCRQPVLYSPGARDSGHRKRRLPRRPNTG